MRCARWSAFAFVLLVPAVVYLLSSHRDRRLAPAFVEDDRGDANDAVLGTVQDDAGPVAEARVRFQGRAGAVFTDSTGAFRLPKPPGKPGRLTAWKEGYLVAGRQANTSPMTLALRRLPTEDCESYGWVGPEPNRDKKQNCGNCHEEIYREWSGDGHSRSAVNRRFLNIYDGTDWRGRRGIGWNLLAENPDGAGVCTACHAPSIPFDDPAYYDLRKVRGIEACGVHCDYCHKVEAIANERFGLTHGRFGLKLLRPAAGQLFFGPLDDVDRGEDAFSPVYHESRYCGSCHEGTVFGVHVYSTYSEWLTSPARREGKQCQTCHMAPTGKMSNFAPGKGGIERDPATLASHRFFAGGLRDMLRRSLKIDVCIANTSSGNVQIGIQLQAENVGHRVPTGFSDRNLLLVVEAWDRNGERLSPSIGPGTLPSLAGKEFAGLPGRLYAKQLRDFDGRQPVPFWRARPKSVDSRLSPGPAEKVSCTFPSHANALRVRFLYRRFWPEVVDTKAWPDDTIVLVDRRFEPSLGREIKWSGP
jgi:hypothetical protein